MQILSTKNEKLLKSFEIFKIIQKTKYQVGAIILFTILATLHYSKFLTLCCTHAAKFGPVNCCMNLRVVNLQIFKKLRKLYRRMPGFTAKEATNVHGKKWDEKVNSSYLAYSDTDRMHK